MEVDLDYKVLGENFARSSSLKQGIHIRSTPMVVGISK